MNIINILGIKRGISIEILKANLIFDLVSFILRNIDNLIQYDAKKKKKLN